MRTNTSKNNTLLFIYNAKSGFGNVIFDMAHKLFSPKTYPCNLCTITHDIFGEKSSWKGYREDSKVNMQFLHIDEFESLFPNQKLKYPIALIKTNNDINVFLSTEEINTLKTVQQLTDLVSKRIKPFETFSNSVCISA